MKGKMRTKEKRKADKETKMMEREENEGKKQKTKVIEKAKQNRHKKLKN